jgi:hypothetical protein
MILGGLSGVMTVRPGVAGVLQMVSELILAVSWACAGQLRRIRWHTGQGRGYVRMTRGSSEMDGIIHMLLTGRTVRVCQYWM